MSQFSREFKLKQHTPIIHFEYQTEGATIRGSELKPKLDKYLIHHFFKDNQSEYKQFLMNSQEGEALDYKVHIIQQEVKPKSYEIEDRFPFVLGCTGKKNKGKYRFVYSTKPIILRVTSLYTKLLEIIENNIDGFFRVHNFGTRQSKGFGSFYRMNTEKNIEKELDETFPYSFILNCNLNLKANGINLAELKKMFADIEIFYKTLRSGINNHKGDGFQFYFKSMLYQYTEDKLKKRWDKPYIKQNLLKMNNHGYKVENEKDFLLVRDLLGLASHTEWYKLKNNKDSKEKVIQASIDKEDSEKIIERYMSPIFFKIIQLEDGKMKVYIDFLEKERIGSILKNHFKFSINGNDDEKFNLHTPDEFDIRDFFKYAIENMTLDEKYKHMREYKCINHIYAQLKGEEA